MPSLAALDKARRATPLFMRAAAIEARLSAAAALGTVHAPRLTKLRSYVRHAVKTFNEAEMKRFLAGYALTFETEITAAHRADDEALIARRAA